MKMMKTLIINVYSVLRYKHFENELLKIKGKLYCFLQLVSLESSCTPYTALSRLGLRYGCEMELHH